MKLRAVIHVATVLVVAVICCGASSEGPSVESCSRSSYALVGDLLQWKPAMSCSNASELVDSNGNSIISNEELGMHLAKPGTYQYRCANKSANLTVVSTQFRMGLCSNCSHQRVAVHISQPIHWTILDELSCNAIRLVTNGCRGKTVDTFTMTSSDVERVYTFNEDGDYQLVCDTDDCRELASITVLGEERSKDFKEIIYSHAVMMVLCFGLVLPLGALLAHLKKPVIHMILQPLGLVVALIGFIMAVVYTEMNDSTHFNQLHSIFGLILVTVALLVLPGLKLSVLLPVREKLQHVFKIWHKRLGLVTVFSGVFNIFLGFSVLPGAPAYITAIYGLWTIILVTVFVAAGVISRPTAREDDEESALRLCCHYRTDRVTLTRQDSLPPSKLSKAPFEEGKFIQLRKKSVDVLDRKLEHSNELPQRKISNVHFGPVAVAAQLTPLPQTPMDNVTQFGFSNQLVNHYQQAPVQQQQQDKSESDDSTSDSESESEESSNDEQVNVDIKTKATSNWNDSQFSLNSIASSGGSLRITRHSDRAHTKVNEIFPPSNLQHSTSPLIRSPLIRSPLFQSKAVRNEEEEEDEEEKQRKEVSPPEDMPKRCPFNRSGLSDSSLPQQRRGRKNAFASCPDEDDRLQLQHEVRRPIQRGLSRNASFRRKQEMVDNTLRSVMEMSDNAIICANAQGEVVFWSAGAMKMFGYTPGEAIGSSLQMIMPQRFKEKHQNGINRRTERANEYIKKHHTAPEEQKHARLYQVTGLSKTGKEFDVDVTVTSFVIEGDIFFTGIISEHKGLNRQLSSSSLTSEVEIREKHQKAMAIGAQMKIAHKLRSADHMSKNELTKILKSSLQGTQFEVPPEDITVMVDGIMKAADAEERGVIKFVDLLDLLVKHRLYISDSGFIAKYGKAKTSDSNMATKNCGSKMISFLSSQVTTLSWGLIYLLVNILLFLIGVFTTPHSGWGQWAYGTGPVLSFNCVLVIIPMMKSLFHNMRDSPLLNKVFPLKSGFFFHVLIACVIFAWTLIHLLTHFCSFSFDDTDPNSTRMDNLTANVRTNLMPIITGAVMILVLLVMSLSSIKPLASLCRSIGFYVIHCVSFIFFYLLLLVHGVDYYNPSFWKWLLPVALAYALERLYFRLAVSRYTAKLLKAAPYDETSRTTKVEVEKPSHYKFVAGQYLLINLPQIGYYSWQPCYISSINKEKTLTLYLPHTGCLWNEKAYKTFKQHPIKPKDDEPNPHTVSITRPFGAGVDHVFDYKATVLLCGEGEAGLSTCRSVIQRFLQYRRKTSSCQCGCNPMLSKLYFVWVTPSGNDNEWFTDFLSELTEDEHLQKYFDIRIFLTNIDSPPDELASALLHLALKTGGPALSVRRPSQPQLSKLYANTSYGIPDFESLLDFVSIQQGTSTDKEVECGVFTAGNIPHQVRKDLVHYCKVCSRKKGPSLDSPLMIDSPYRSTARKLSSPQPEGPPPEWHITFKYQPLIL